MIVNPELEGNSFSWPGGPVGLLLIHGFTATTAEVRPLASRLHARGYTISGPLLPGHNTSPEDLNRVSWRDWTGEAERAYQELRLHCQTIVTGGESTGGLLALYLAAQHPEIAGILAYAPALRLNRGWSDYLKLYLFAPFIPYVPKFVTPQPNPYTDPLWQGYHVNPLKGTIQLLRLQKQVSAVLGDIRQPVLIAQGRLDKTVHPGVPELISQNISSNVKEIIWLEHSTHCVILDQELDRVTDLTLDFLQRILQPEAGLTPRAGAA
jgi:carboxylesterase